MAGTHLSAVCPDGSGVCPNLSPSPRVFFLAGGGPGPSIQVASGRVSLAPESDLVAVAPDGHRLAQAHVAGSAPALDSRFGRRYALIAWLRDQMSEQHSA